MAITKSAKKAFRQSVKRGAKNLKQKKGAKKLLKEIGKAIIEKNSEEAKKFLPNVYKALDKLAKTGIIKKNAASRKKSRLSQAINKINKA